MNDPVLFGLSLLFKLQGQLTVVYHFVFLVRQLDMSLCDESSESERVVCARNYGWVSFPEKYNVQVHVQVKSWTSVARFFLGLVGCFACWKEHQS